jgi:hypothetical protein
MLYQFHSKPISLVTNNIVRLMVSGAGNVGIGTTSPATALQVNGTARATRLNSTGGVVDFDAETGNNFIQIASNIVSIANGGNVSMTITATGNVGIGTTSPSSKLQVDGTITVTNGGINIPADSPIRRDGDNSIIGYSSALPGINIGSGTATDMVVFNAGGVERIRVNTLGNVGIGTAAPSYRLHVVGTIGNNGGGVQFPREFRNDFTPNAERADIFFFSNFTSNNALRIGTLASSGGTTLQSTRANDSSLKTSLLLNPDGGNVGIGTTAPGYKLTVNGDVDVNNGAILAAQPYGINLGVSGYDIVMPATTRIAIKTEASERISILNTGNVGIGTTSPSSLIHGKGIASSDVTYRFEPIDNNYKSTVYISSVSSGDSGFRYDSGINQMSQFSYGDMIFYVGTANISGTIGDERLRIKQGGNVGIGTTSPSAKLTVVDDAATGNGLIVTGGGGGGAIATFVRNVGSTGTTYVHSSGGNPQITFINEGVTKTFSIGSNGSSFRISDNNQTGTNDRFVIETSGNVGIGTTSPSAKLHVYNAGNSFIKIDSDATSPYMAGVEFLRSSINGGRIYNDGGAVQVKLESYFGYDSANPTRGGFMFKTAPVTSGTLVDAVRIDARGYVGIGTTSPGSNLDVQSVTGTLRLGNNIGSVATGAVVGKIEFSNVDTSIGAGVQAYIQSRAIDNGATYAMDFFTGTKDNPTQTNLSLYNGNVGIGTTSPSTALDVVGTITAYRYQAISSSASLVGYGVGTGLGMFNAGTDTLGFATASTERLRITSAGNVGIGTTSPVSKLNINNDDAWINVVDNLRGLQFGYAGPSHGSYRAAVMGGAESYGGTDSGMLTFHTQNGYVVSAIPPERMRILSNGDVAIGATYSVDHLYVSKTAGSSIGIGTGGVAGTVASPLYTSLNFRGYGDYIKGQIQSYDVSSNAVGGLLTFSVQDTGATLTERMRIHSALATSALARLVLLLSCRWKTLETY